MRSIVADTCQGPLDRGGSEMLAEGGAWCVAQGLDGFLCFARCGQVVFAFDVAGEGWPREVSDGKDGQ